MEDDSKFSLGKTLSSLMNKKGKDVTKTSPILEKTIKKEEFKKYTEDEDNILCKSLKNKKSNHL